MSTSGWTGEAPEAGTPAMPLTELLLDRQERRAGVLETALARSRAADAREARERAAGARDPDDFAAQLVTRGYAPGLMTQLSQRLGDTLAELADEEGKIEKAAQRSERVRRDHAAGRITVFDIARMQAAAGDDGDPGKVARLQRRADRLRRQLGEAAAMMSPAQDRAADPLEAATQRAMSAGHEAFLVATRAAWAGQSAPERRPFASVSRSAGGAAQCAECREIGATAAESAALHAEMDAGGGGELTEAELAEYGRQAGMAYRPAAAAG